MSRTSKSALSMLLSVIMLIGLSAVPNVITTSAAENSINSEKLPITIETVEANPGATNVEVKVFIPADPHWSAIQFTVRFDPSLLTFSKFEVNEAVRLQQTGGKPVIFAMIDDKADEGEVLISFASSVTDGGYEGYYNVRKGTTYDYFGILLFDVAADAKGLQEITVEIDGDVKAIGESGDQVAIEYTTTNGGIQLPGGEEPPVEPCEHEWDEGVVTTPATCKDEGVKTYTCSKCGETKTEAIPVDSEAHDWVEGEMTYPTCEEAGKIVYTCSICGDVIEESIEAFGHDWGEWCVIKEATCTEDGEQTRYCPNCEKVETEVIEALGHDWGEPEYDIYIYDNSWVNARIICGRCGEEYEETADMTIEPIVEPTCCDVGYGIYTATFDNAYGIFETQSFEEYIPALGHVWSEWETVTAATCTNTGERIHICNVCSIFETEVIPLLPHDWSEWEVTVPNTWKSEGEKTRVCFACGLIETKAIPVAQLMSIEFVSLPMKTVYVERKGELDMTGAVLALYYDNSDVREARIEKSGSLFKLYFNDSAGAPYCTVSGFNNTKLGKQTITVTYNGKSASFEIEVIEKAIERIEFIDFPTKTEYAIGETLNLNGGKVRIVYDNDTSETARLITISGSHCLGFENTSVSVVINVSGFNPQTNGYQTVTIEYLGVAVTFTVKVGQASDVKKGDPDGDGEITVNDALKALRVAAKLAEATDEMIACCDIDGDGEITVNDALKILRVAAKLADESSLW